MAEDTRKRIGRPFDTRLDVAILEAVVMELSEIGYARLTTASVAKRAEVSTATLYRRWPSKRDLVLATAGQIAEHHSELADTGSLAGDVRALLDVKRETMHGHLGPTIISLIGEAAHDTELSNVLRQALYAPIVMYIETFHQRALARGESQPDISAETAAQLLVGYLFGGLWLGKPGAEDDEAVARAISGSSVRG